MRSEMLEQYQLRFAYASLPGSELAEAIWIAGIDGSSPPHNQVQTLLAKCARASMGIATLFEHRTKSDIDRGNENG